MIRWNVKEVGRKIDASAGEDRRGTPGPDHGKLTPEEYVEVETRRSDGRP